MIQYKEALRNERLLGLEIFLAAPFIVIVTQYAPVLITRLGASPLLIGAFTSAPALVTSLMAALGPRYIALIPNFRVSVGVPATIWRLLMVVIPLALLAPAFRPEIIVFGAVCLSFGAGLTNFTVPAYFPRLTVPERLGKMIGRRWTLLGLGMTLSTPILGYLLGALSQPLNYFVVCGIGIITTIAGLTTLLMVRVPPVAAADRTRRKELSVSELVQYPGSVRFLLVALLMHLAINAAGPLVTLRMVRGLNASDSDFGWYYAIFWVVLALVGLVSARITERFGNRLTFAISGIGLGAQLLILAFATVLPVTWLSAILSGLASVLFQVSAYGLLVDYAPSNRYEGFTGWNTIIANIGILVAPMLMTALVSGGMDITAGLIVCAVFRAASGLAALIFLKRS